MGSEGDAATISNMTEPQVNAGEMRAGPSGSSLFASTTNWTVSNGCLDDARSTAGPITPTQTPAVIPSIAPGTGLSATGPAITYQGQPVTLASINWYGAEQADFVPGGLQCQSLSTIASEIKQMGFNSVRLPWSNAMLEQNPQPCPEGQPASLLVCIPPEVLTANPTLQHEHAMNIYAQVVSALTNAGLMVILDNHGTDAAWTPGNFNLSGLWWGGQFWDNQYGFGANPAGRTNQWVVDWEQMVYEFRSNPYVIGADLRNEPSTTPYGPCEDHTQCQAEWGSSVAWR